MLRYSLLLLGLAHCAVNGLVNDGDAAKSARLASVVTVDPLPMPVVGLLPSNDVKVANATPSSNAAQKPNSTQLANSGPSNATGNANATKTGDVVQKANVTEMGDPRIKTNADPKSADGSSTIRPSPVDNQDSEMTKSTLNVESAEKQQTDIKDPTPKPHLDSKDSPVPKEDGGKPQGSSTKDDIEVSSTTETAPNNKPSENEGGTETTILQETSTATSTVSTQQTTSEKEVTDSSSPSSSSTTAKTSTTDESVSSPTTSSSATEQTTTEAGAPTVEATHEDEGMSSGIVALIMAIVFAVVVVIVYVGLLLWRRYLEYRYGTRELLVNDLEFDTNDLRHFEL